MRSNGTGRVRALGATRVALLLAISALACTQGAPPGGTLELRGRALFRGLERHAGIVVALVGPSASLTVTDTAGTYRFEGLVPGTYAVTASARSTRERSLTELVTVGDTRATVPEFVFEAVGALRGRVSLAGGSDASGVVVTIPSAGVAGVTGADGAFLFRDLPVGQHAVRAERAGYRSGVAPSVAVTYDTIADAPELVLAEGGGGGAIRGEVRIAGADSNAGASVLLVGPSTAARVTGADGRFELTGLADGDYAVSASADAATPAIVRSAVSVRGEVSVSLATFHLAAVGEVEGQLTLLGETSHAATIVVLTPASGGSPLASATDESGTFRMVGVRVGEYRVSASRAGFRAPAIEAVLVRRGEISRVPAGALVREPTLGLGSLAGVVRRVDASDHAGLRVQIGVDGPSALTAADGTFTIVDVPAGLYSLFVRGAPFEEDVPSVLALPGAGAFFFSNGVLSALEPIEVGRARRIASVEQILGTVSAPEGDAFLILAGDEAALPLVSLWIARGNGGAPSRLSGGAIADTVAFSSDGRAVFWLEPTEGDLGVTRLLWAQIPVDASSAPIPSVAAFAVEPPVSLSTGGGHVAFVSLASSPEGTLQVLALSSGRVLDFAQGARASDVRWSADGRRAAFLAGELRGGLAERLAIVDLESGAIREIDSGAHRKMEVSPLGDYLLFTVPGDVDADVGALRVVAFEAGGARELASDARRPFVYSPGGSHVAFYAGRGEGLGIWTVRAAALASGPSRVLGTVTAEAPRWGATLQLSRTGNRLLFTNAGESSKGLASLYVASTDVEGSARLLTDETPLDWAAQPKLTDDGLRVLFLARFDRERGVGVLQASATAAPAPVDLAGDVSPFGFALTPGGEHAVFFRGLDVEGGSGELWWTSISTPAPVRVASAVRVAVSDPAPGFPFVLQGSTTAIVLSDFLPRANTGTLRKVDLTTGASSTLATGVAPDRFVHRDDARGICFVADYDGATQTGVLGFVADGAQQPVLSSDRLALAEWMDLRNLPIAQGQALVFGPRGFSGGSALYAMSLETGALRVLDAGVSEGDVRISAGGARAHWRAFDPMTQATTRWRAFDLAPASEPVTILRGVTALDTTPEGVVFAIKQGSGKAVRFQDGVYLERAGAP